MTNARLLLNATYRELDTLLTYTKPQIQQYFALTEAQLGPAWIGGYLIYIHEQPQYADHLLYETLRSSPIKSAAAYLASMFTAYFIAPRKDLSPLYNGYQQLERYFKKSGTILLILEGREYYFKI